MTITNAVRQGVDLEALERFTEFAAANRGEVQFGLEAVGEYEGRAVHTTTTTGPYTLGGERIDRLARRYTRHYGAHKEVEAALGFTDPTDREEVIEAVLAALTGCINATVSTSALLRGIELDQLITTVSVGWDPFVFLHLTEPEHDGSTVGQFRDLRIELTVAGDGLTEEDLGYLQQSVRRSAVYNLVTTANPSSPVIRTAEKR